MTPDNSIIAGAAPFNVTYSRRPAAQTVLLQDFSIFLQSLLTDPLHAIPASTVTEDCQMAGEGCYAYVLPGEFVLVSISSSSILNYTELLSLPHENANVYVAENVSVYQLEFFPPQNSTALADNDCNVYEFPLNQSSLKICLTNEGDDLIAGEFLHGRAKKRLACLSYQHSLGRWMLFWARILELYIDQNRPTSHLKLSGHRYL